MIYCLKEASFFKNPGNYDCFLLKCVALNLPASIYNILLNRAHSTLDRILERMIHAVPGDEEIQEQPHGHALWLADN